MTALIATCLLAWQTLSNDVKINLAKDKYAKDKWVEQCVARKGMGL